MSDNDEYNKTAVGGEKIRQVGVYCYDKQNRVYQFQLLPRPGWYLVNNRRGPESRSTVRSAAKGRHFGSE